MGKGNKVLIIGLDGATWRILGPMIEGGTMPNLRKMIDEGTRGTLNSTLPALTPPAMASFHTGVQPNRHGIYDFSQYRRGSYKPTFVNSQSLRHKTIWDMLSNAGKRIVLIGVPLTYPPPKIDGAVVSGFLAPSTKSDFVFPAELKRKLLNSIGEYRFICSPPVFYQKGLNAFLEDAIFTEKKKNGSD